MFLLLVITDVVLQEVYRKTRLRQHWGGLPTNMTWNLNWYASQRNRSELLNVLYNCTSLKGVAVVVEVSHFLTFLLEINKMRLFAVHPHLPSSAACKHPVCLVDMKLFMTFKPCPEMQPKTLMHRSFDEDPQDGMDQATEGTSWISKAF